MKPILILAGLLATFGTVAQEATLDLSPKNLPGPDPAITDCAQDFHKRGHPSEQPVDPEAVAQLRAALDADLRATAGGLDQLQALEPLCFYHVHPDGFLLMRDGRGLKYYFRQVPKWELERVDVITGPAS